MDDDWIPIIGMICVFGLPIAGWITIRVLQHRERMAMLQHGIVPPPQGRRLRGGMSPEWTAAQPPWTPGAMPPTYAYDDPNSPQCMLRKGITTAMVGFALLIGLSFIGYHGGDGPFQPASLHPGPWLLGGLIPMFVGIAQIIIALLSGAQLSFPRGMAPPGPTGPGPVPPGAPFPKYGAPPQPGSPGTRYEELARPVPPPDRS
jgi:hypothetical protein